MATSSTHTENLRMYVNDMLALEREIHDAVKRQQDDANIQKNPDTLALVRRLHAGAHGRLHTMHQLAEELGGGAGAAVKEAVAAATGTLAGLYGMVRKHPVSRMLRDDYVALSLGATAYSMLYTTAVAVRNSQVAAVAQQHLRELTPLVVDISEHLPTVVVRELAEDDSDVDMNAAGLGQKATLEAWSTPK